MPSPIIIVLIALGISVVGNAALAKFYVGAKEDLATEKQAFSSFKDQVRTLGEIAAAEAKAKGAADKQRKEKADAENKVAFGKLNARIGELRHQRDSAISGFLSATPPGSRCPDGQTCFERAEYLGAYRELVQEVRGAADEGAAVVIDLDTAKRWAQSGVR